MPHTDDWFQKQANSFDSAAEVYERSRPGYPADAVDWLMASAPSTVLDLGAGTGKFTRLISDRVDTVIVTVDSRRARRGIQEYAPRRVFDASTTDVTAVVMHAHEQPTDGACLACIYPHIPDEHARERSIAEGLGLDLDTVARGFIDEDAASRILQTHPGLDKADLIGKAFDTLFRQLCATQALTTPEGRQVLTPFAFVSSLAGALIVVEMLRRAAGVVDANYWQVDPWLGPLARLRKYRSRSTECVFCSSPAAQALVQRWWG